MAQACLLVCSAQASAEIAAASNALNTATATTTQLPSVVVKGQSLPREASSASRTVLDAERIREAQVDQPEQLLRQVPGVDVRNYNLGGVVNVIAIRGFGGGAHGGDLGMMIDGIPLNEAMSHSDGYADLNVIVPLEIQRFEVFRGPVSALYGNFNRGGLVAIESRRGGQYTQLDASAGSFGTVDLQAAAGTPLGGGQFNGAVQLWKTDDFRPDSQYRRGTAAARWTVPVSAATHLSFSTRVHDGDWDSASYVLKSDFDAGNRRGKDARVQGDGGNKRFGTLRVDADHALSGELKLLAFAYGTQQDYTRFFTRPLNATTWSQREESYDRAVAGTGLSLNGNQRWGGVPVAWVAGAEAYRERTDYQFYEGLSARTRARTRPASAVYDRRYRFNSLSAFGEMTALVAPWFKPSLGLRHDRFSGGCDKGAETGADACASLNTLSKTSPKLGVRSTLLPGLDLRASHAIGFALPPGVAKFAPGGAQLKPTAYRQNELGLSFKNALVQVDLARYDMESRNEVRAVSPGVFENFGVTRRQGTELALSITPMEALALSLVGARTQARVLENANPALVGKRLTGVPKASATLGVAWRPERGFGASLGWRWQDDIAVDAPNTLVAGGFSTLDLALHYRWAGWRAHLKLDNAADRDHASNLFIIGGQQLVAPGSPRTLRVGLQADF
jgi:iron complex outermembrane recepter protein